MAQVTFSPADFRAAYPEFSTLSDAQLNSAFGRACLQVSNSDSSPISDLVVRATILYMVVAQIAALNYGVGGEAASPLVGRIESAAEGSVNVSVAYAPAAGSRAWWDQTKYGAEAWQALAPYRAARYVAPCQPSWPGTFGRLWP